MVSRPLPQRPSPKCPTASELSRMLSIAPGPGRSVEAIRIAGLAQAGRLSFVASAISRAPPRMVSLPFAKAAANWSSCSLSKVIPLFSGVASVVRVVGFADAYRPPRRSPSHSMRPRRCYWMPVIFVGAGSRDAAQGSRDRVNTDRRNWVLFGDPALHLSPLWVEGVEVIQNVRGGLARF